MIEQTNLSRTEAINIINEWIFKERDRRILIRKMLDGLTFEQVAEEFDMSPRQIQRIVRKGEDRFFKHVPENAIGGG